MDKQELIDKAVEQFGGVWPKFNWDEVGASKHAIVQTIKYWDDEDEDITHQVGEIQKGGTKFDKDYTRLVCLRREFEQRASELGWVNGYKWGVEYPTNGKKPDLPDGTEVRRKFKNTKVWKQFSVKCNEHDWDCVSSFRIEDERYKTKEPVTVSYCAKAGAGSAGQAGGKGGASSGQAGVEPDSSWYDRGEIPPEETICESYDFAHSQWVKVKTLNAKTGSREIACVTIDESEAYGRLFFGCKFRLIKSERDRQYEFAASNMLTSRISNTQRKTINRMLDIGFRAPDEKSIS